MPSLPRHRAAVRRVGEPLHEDRTTAETPGPRACAHSQSDPETCWSPEAEDNVRRRTPAHATCGYTPPLSSPPAWACALSGTRTSSLSRSDTRQKELRWLR